MKLKNLTEKEEEILDLIDCYGGTDGAHHKQWVLDRILQILLKEKYGDWVRYYEEDGEYEWDQGVAPLSIEK